MNLKIMNSQLKSDQVTSNQHIDELNAYQYVGSVSQPMSPAAAKKRVFSQIALNKKQKKIQISDKEKMAIFKAAVRDPVWPPQN